MITPLPRFNKTVTQRQKGDFLVEALIGTFLTGIIGLGVMLTTAKVMLGQRDMATDEIVISQLRQRLQNHIHDGSDLDACKPNQKIKSYSGADVPIKNFNCGTLTFPSYKLLPVAPARQISTSDRIVLETDDGLYQLGGKPGAN